MYGVVCDVWGGVWCGVCVMCGVVCDVWNGVYDHLN